MVEEEAAAAAWRLKVDAIDWLEQWAMSNWPRTTTWTGMGVKASVEVGVEARADAMMTKTTTQKMKRKVWLLKP